MIEHFQHLVPLNYHLLPNLVQSPSNIHLHHPQGEQWLPHLLKIPIRVVNQGHLE